MTTPTILPSVQPEFHDLSDRDLRQRDLVPKDRLCACRITVVGIGAIGRQVALQLAAIGAPQLQLVDHDRVEVVNLAPQGYLQGDLGSLKVDATGSLIHQINPAIDLELIPERFRVSRGDWGSVLFLCVDSIETRKRIWDAVKGSTAFFCDGRMSAQTMRILTAANTLSRAHYASTLFPASEAYHGSCTAKSTVYCATIAAGMMVNSFAKWLRDLPLDQDLALNLLSSELTSPSPPMIP